MLVFSDDGTSSVKSRAPIADSSPPNIKPRRVSVAQTFVRARSMARLATRRGSRSTAFLALFALLCLARGAAAEDEDDVPEASFDEDEDDLPPSEDVPLWSFETTVVTVGKASGKEKHVEKPAFFLRGDDPCAAATRFVYLHSLPLGASPRSIAPVRRSSTPLRVRRSPPERTLTLTSPHRPLVSPASPPPLPPDHIPRFTSIFRHEWDTVVPEASKPRARARRGPPVGPATYLARGKAHVAAGRDDEAHFDFARAVVGVGSDEPDLDPSERLSPEQTSELDELLREHHRRRSRALNAADARRESRAKAHERESRAASRRRELRRALADDLADFDTLWAAAAEVKDDVEKRDIDAPSAPANAPKPQDPRLVAAVAAKDWRAALDVVSAIDKTGAPLDQTRKLAGARAAWSLGRWRDVERYASAAVSAGRAAGDWRRGQARAVAVGLGAAASVRRGDADAALKFYAAAKRADPDTPLFKTPYRLIKDAEKLMKEADLRLDRGESRAALESADEAYASLRGLGASPNSAMFAPTDARRCRAHAQMRAFELALEACDGAMRALGCGADEGADEGADRGADGGADGGATCASADPKTRARVLAARAETHSRDTYPEGALADLRAALEIIEPVAQRGSSEAGRLAEEMMAAYRQAERDKHAHENNRDHAKMLDLPENLHELPKERRCEFIKKAYKKAALKWHPDKATEAGKRRAARKMNEMTEARDAVSERAGCVERKRDPEEDRRGGGRGGYQHQWHQQQAYEQFFRQQHQGRQRRGGGGGRYHWEF